jgi:hypothetical protein
MPEFSGERPLPPLPVERRASRPPSRGLDDTQLTARQ